jgi:hypothetical protein
MTLDMFDSTPGACTTADNFCYTDWTQFPNAATFN